MSKFKFELNRDGVKELLKGAEMKGILMDCAERVRDTAGDEYAIEQVTGANRSWMTIRPDTPHAYYSNLKHNTLLKALGSVKRG